MRVSNTIVYLFLASDNNKQTYPFINKYICKKTKNSSSSIKPSKARASMTSTYNLAMIFNPHNINLLPKS